MVKEIKTLNVEGMSCKHCENSVIKAVSALKGVSSVSVDLSSKKVSVQFDSEQVTVNQIQEAIEDQGYEIR